MEPKKRNIALTYGLIAGVSMILFMWILYRGGVELYIGSLAYLGYAILIGLAAAAALAQKKVNGGYLEFSEALKTCFTVFVIGLALQTLFTLLLLNVFDTHFRGQLAVAMEQKSEAMFRKMGMPEDQLRQLKDSQTDVNQFSVGRTTLGLAFTYIVHFIIAMLIAALVKKKKTSI